VSSASKYLKFSPHNTGVSNIAFGFRGNEPIRRAFHSAFLHHACKAGMDMGIVQATQVCAYDALCSWAAPGLIVSAPILFSCKQALFRGKDQFAYHIEMYAPNRYTSQGVLRDFLLFSWSKVQEDAYEKIDKNLLLHVEDALLNRWVWSHLYVT